MKGKGENTNLNDKPEDIGNEEQEHEIEING
jgi:hypothetical protein